MTSSTVYAEIAAKRGCGKHPLLQYKRSSKDGANSNGFSRVYALSPVFSGRSAVFSASSVIVGMNALARVPLPRCLI